MYLECDGCRFALEGVDLVIGRNGTEWMRLPLVPSVEDEAFEIGTWQRVQKDHYRMDVRNLGSVHLAIREGHVCYWIETPRTHLPRLTYFPDSQPTQTRWHTFLSDELDRCWSVNENADVPLSSSYVGNGVDGVDGEGMTDPGDKPPTWIFNVPPRAFAIETPGGWMGLSVPGPLSVGVTRLTMRRGVFDLIFEELRPTSGPWGPPRVYFVPGLSDPYDTLDQHRLISESCGLARRTCDPQPKWWSYPSFKCADELLRRQGRFHMEYDESGKVISALTTKDLLAWIDHVESYAGIKGRMNLQLDQHWFHGYGGREVLDTLGGTEGLRATIDLLRERDVHVGLYIHLCFIDPAASDFPVRHPEAICKPKDPSTIAFHGAQVGSHELNYIDWTHPVGRQFMLDHIEWLLSDKPGCLNADWLLINNNLSVDPRKFEFHDPDWGTGDLMTMKITKLAYEHAKRIKSDGYVRRQSPGDPYMQPWFDQANLCEEWNGQTTAWYRRAQIATRVLDNCILHADAWFATLTKLAEYYFGLATVHVPEIESVKHAIHPYMNYRDMRPKDYNRIRAGVQTYLNAPFLKSDTCRVTYNGLGRQPELWRKRTTGPLVGWYAALALHERCVVTYSESEARVAASKELKVTVPLPPGSTLQAVESVTHEGDIAAYPYEQPVPAGEASVSFWVPDAGEEIMYVAVRYDLR